jgi:hypothetical protein
MPDGVCMYFHTKHLNFDMFWKALEWKILLYFMAIWCTHLLSFGIFYYHFVVWYTYIFLRCV